MDLLVAGFGPVGVQAGQQHLPGAADGQRRLVAGGLDQIWVRPEVSLESENVVRAAQPEAAE